MRWKTAFIYTLIIMFTFLKNVKTRKRTFTCAVVNVHSVEYDAVMIALSLNSSRENNITFNVQKLDFSDNSNHFYEASTFIQQNVAILIEGSNTKIPACELSKITGVPLIQLHADNRPFEQCTCEKAVQMAADYRDYAHASLNIVNKFQWQKIALLFDENRLQEASYFYVKAGKSGLSVNLIQLAGQEISEDRNASILAAMEEIRGLEPEIILPFTTKENTEIFLQQKPCLHKKGFKWILHQGQMPLNLNGHENNVVLTMKLPYFESQDLNKVESIFQSTYKNTNKELFALAYDSAQVLKQALNKESCSYINGTALTLNDTAEILTCVKKVNLNGRTGKVQFDENGNRKDINLEILNLQNNSFQRIGTWNSTKGATIFGNNSRNVNFTPTGNTLEGTKLRVVTVEGEPYVVMRQEGGTIWYEGYCIDLFKELAKILKFSYEFYRSPDGFYGTEIENGTWNGMIGELIRNRADIIVAPIAVTLQRKKVVDFTVPYMFYTNDMLMKKASLKENMDLLQFMNPFHNNVWFCTLATLVIISVAVFGINHYSPYGNKNESGQGTSNEFSYYNSLWFAVACMLQQGGDNTPRSLSGRILTGCYWFCILIWVSTYTANLAAFFTVKNADRSINNLEDLAKSSYEVGVVHSTSEYQYFKESQYPSHQKIWRRMQAANTFAKTTAEAVKWVREREKFVLITDGLSLRHIAKQPPCDLKTVPGLSSTQGLAFGLQADDPHTIDLTLATLHLQENHVLEDLYRKWWQTSNTCSEEENTILSQKQIGLRSMLGVYIVLGVGMVLAFITLMAEIYWKRGLRGKVFNTFRRFAHSWQGNRNSLNPVTAGP